MRTVSCLVAAVVLAPNVHAQPAVADDEVRPLTPITVIASPASANPASLFTLSRADFAPFDPMTAVEVLRRIPGVNIDRSGNAGSVSSLYLRGGDPNWTVIFLDGVRINDPTNSRGGSVDLSFLDPAMIERIDVIRGPASATLGSDAISGAINIVTRAPADVPQGSIGAEAGTRHYARGDAHAAGPIPGGAFSIYAGASDSGSQVEGGAARLRSLSTRFRSSSDLPGALDIGVHAFDGNAHAFPDDSGGPRYALIRDVERRHAEQQDGAVHYEWPELAGLRLSVLTTFLHRQESGVSPGVAPGLRDPIGIPPNRVNTRYERQTFRLIGEKSVGSGIRVALGTEFAHERGVSSGTLDLDNFVLPTDFSLSRSTIAGFGEMQLALGDATVLGSVRVDHADTGETVTSPRLGVVYAIDNATDIRTSYGKGFKLPSFFALSNPIVGNPNLIPERSASIDAAVAHRFAAARGEISLALFRSGVEHAIDFDPGPPPRLVNRSVVKSSGGEVALRFKVAPDFGVVGQIGIANARALASDAPLRNRPHLQGTLGVVATPLESIEASLALTFVGHNADSSIPTGDRTVPSYARLDGTVSYRCDRALRVTLAIDNLLDRQYEEMVGFPGPRRTVRLGVSYAL